MKRAFLLSHILLSVLLTIGCNKKQKPSKESNKKTIILSKESSNYTQWIEGENIIILDAYTIENTDSILALADGIILTGGEDINPLQYNDTINIKVCGPINDSRDTLERKLFDFAFKNKLPLIGVCRGMQMINVARGGTLYGDIPTEIGKKVIHRNKGEVNHEISLCSNYSYYTNLIFPENIDTFSVNSWHHQGLKNIGQDIHILAKSYDGLPEAAAIDTSIHPFIIAVQFHPERLGKENGIHQTMKTSFFNAINSNHKP